MSLSNLQYYVIICDKKYKKKFSGLAADFGGGCIDVMYGKGSANTGAFAKALGFDTEEHKVVISFILPTYKARELTDVLKTDHDFHKKNTGIAFSIPIGGLSL